MKIKELLVALGILGPLIDASQVSAQPASLNGQLYMGLSVTGTVGMVYAIQATTNVVQTNGWTCLTFIQLPTTNFVWVDASAPATGQRFYRAVTSSPTNLAFIPPGTFRMGSPTNEVDRSANEGPQTAVTISRGFWMGIYPVTQAQYQLLIGSNPSSITGNLNRPVETVSWNDATNYCAKLTQQELATGQIPAGSQYRLPTEAEWEYACRAWTSDRRFYYGDDPGYTNLTNYAWYTSNTTSTQPVGQKLPNSWGLYDMNGNVQQWCQDYGAAPYPGGSVTDPQGPSFGNDRVYRGGSWFTGAAACRSASRGGSFPTGVGFSTGFRVVLAVDQ
jgi:formylglycine-generating enzyme required for sulfatase activity